MHYSACERRSHHRQESCRANRDGAESIHESLQQSFFLILIAVADADSPGVPPDLGSHKQKTQTRRG